MMLQDDEHALFPSKTQLEELGILRVICRRCQDVTIRSHEAECDCEEPGFEALGPIHEKAKKAGSHQAL